MYLPIAGPATAHERGQPVGLGLPSQRPPWSKLIAVNARSGQVVWESVLGVNDLLPEGKGRVGNSRSAGATVRLAGSSSLARPNDRRFWAFDARTGKGIWTTMLDANANANPMSYQGR